jgi:hypothetical protein
VYEKLKERGELPDDGDDAIRSQNGAKLPVAADTFINPGALPCPAT